MKTLEFKAVNGYFRINRFFVVCSRFLRMYITLKMKQNFIKREHQLKIFKFDALDSIKSYRQINTPMTRGRCGD